MLITIDTSAILSTLVNEAHKKQIIRVTKDCDLQSPASLDAEIGNALSAMIKRNRLTLNEAQEVIEQFDRIPIRRTSIRFLQVLELVNAFKIYAYDAYVLDCARQYQTPLLSLDKKMIKIAEKLNIVTLEVSL